MVRRIALLLAVVLIGMSVYGCSKTQQEKTPIKTEKIRMLMCKTDENIQDADRVIDRLNEYLAPLMQIELEVIFIKSENWSKVTSQYFSSGEQLDLMYGKIFGLRDYYRSGDLLPLDDLLKQYGGGITDTLGAEFLQVGRDNGAQFAVTTNRDLARGRTFVYRQDIAEAYNLNLDTVKTLDDLERVFVDLTSQTDEIIPLANCSYNAWDSLGDDLGVLIYPDESADVVNLYETQEYREYIERMYRWRKNGWLVDTLTSLSSNTAYLRSGHVLGCFAPSKPGMETQETRAMGYPMKVADFTDPFITTSGVGALMWGIPANSVHPEKAMQFLNLMYTDAYVYNLLTFGLEGEHYEFVDREAGVIDYPAGVDAKSSGYAQFQSWVYGNQFLSYIWNGDGLDIWDQMDSFNKTSKRSVALGFYFDPAPIRKEWYDCLSVKEEYAEGLAKGYLDPEETLEEFLDKLEQAGIRDIIAEKQSQLNRWLSEKTK